ncbi:MAG: hypothetical protein ACI9CE_002252 [Flavobacterium sp.]
MQNNFPLERVSWEEFADHQMPFIACLDIAVFKAFFNRTKDWADLAAMNETGTLNVQQVRAILTEYLAEDDDRIKRLLSLDL